MLHWSSAIDSSEYYNVLLEQVMREVVNVSRCCHTMACPAILGLGRIFVGRRRWILL